MSEFDTLGTIAIWIEFINVELTGGMIVGAIRDVVSSSTMVCTWTAFPPITALVLTLVIEISTVSSGSPAGVLSSTIVSEIVRLVSYGQNIRVSSSKA